MRTDNTGSESSSPGGSFVERLLDEQQDLSAVERFAQRNDDHQSASRAEHYRDLIPLTEPTQGEQYAFDVNLDACTGCKACVTAGHNLNGLDDDEVWRDVG
ncbi:MAG: molybdopterin oxidoreductase, partial [Deltaproteobacteria bacterium]|nr:molybdopterin oxidoreductase [Deltaproteobacteria bacterium]